MSERVASRDVIEEAIPDTFVLLPEGLGFLDSLQPVYRLADDSVSTFGLRVADQHVNTMGICHGGVLMTLADVVAATGVNVARGVISGSPTINLQVDFVSSAKRGQWLHATAEQVSLKRRFGFCRGGIYHQQKVIATFSGTFYHPEHEGLARTSPDRDPFAVN